MAIGIDQFPILSFEQANPLLAGLQAGQNIYAQGVRNQYMPQTLQQQLQQLQLNNAAQQIKNQYMPQDLQSQISLRQAQIPVEQAQAGLIGTEAAKNKFLLNNPMMMLPGIAGQLGGYMYLQQHNPELFNNQNTNSPNPSPSTSNSAISQNNNPMMGNGNSGFPSTNNLGQLLMSGITAPIQKDLAVSNYLQKKSQGYDFTSLPVDQRESLVSQASGMGYDPMSAVQYLMNGATINDLAKAKGFDPSNMPDPIYPASKQSINLIQRRNQALNEINTLNPILTSALAPYAQRVNGYSPKQIAQAISNDNPDQQAKFLAAKALMPELSSLRLKAMGGNVGIEAMNEVKNASMGNIKSFDSLVTPQVYQQAQQYVDQWITQGATAANKTAYNRMPLQNTSMTNNGAPQSNLTKVLNGKTYTKVNGQWYEQ